MDSECFIDNSFDYAESTRKILKMHDGYLTEQEVTLIGDIKDNPKDNCILDNADMAGYADDINTFIRENDLPEEYERGLMHWYHPEGNDDEIAEKVYFAHCTVEVINGELTGVITAKIIGELSDESMERFIDYCVGQLSDGWGESLEQKYMRTENGEINISFWSDDEAWALVPEDEYLNDNTQDMEMSM